MDCKLCPFYLADKHPLRMSCLAERPPFVSDYVGYRCRLYFHEPLIREEARAIFGDHKLARVSYHYGTSDGYSSRFYPSVEDLEQHLREISKTINHFFMTFVDDKSKVFLRVEVYYNLPRQLERFYRILSDSGIALSLRLLSILAGFI